ncbi:Peptidyl-prolyl cis-trans isomerase FKBP65 [Camellia lanceoleosa]|uniref:Peptidyl-prolyl cis-trans isomerase FKBP65 n=1 Tax=Camellia lanceoleosa TaxID=1840588 RepID=A0ACC0I257_9ERIC|nr:Peptidyl-prolyl cis-trans isomerase FKBP65 [Camellia lanceoleosa]
MTKLTLVKVHNVNPNSTIWSSGIGSCNHYHEEGGDGIVDAAPDLGYEPQMFARIKKVMEKGEQIGLPSDLDYILVMYQVRLDDGAMVATTPEGSRISCEIWPFCPALPKALNTVRRGEKVNLIIQPKSIPFEEVIQQFKAWIVQHGLLGK